MTRKDLLTYNGITQPIHEWALDYGITPELIMKRLGAGMSVEAAVTKPMIVRKGEKLPDQAREVITLTFNGRTLTLSEWAKVTGVKRSVLAYRLAVGWSVERILTTPRIARGVSSDLAASLGTGGGSVAQEIPNIGKFA